MAYAFLSYLLFAILWLIQRHLHSRSQQDGVPNECEVREAPVLVCADVECSVGSLCRMSS